jgi:hypothetical protein
MHHAQFLCRKAAGGYLKDKYGFGSERTLAKLACLGGGPEFRKAGSTVLYEPAKLDEWAISKVGQPQRSTSDTVIDTLQASFNGDDSNSNAQVVKFLRSFRPITELAHKPTVLIPAHPIKNAGDDQLVPYGGGGILNEIDGNLTLSLKGDVVTLHYQDKLRGVPFDPVHFKSALETADELTDECGDLAQLPVLRPAKTVDLKAAEEREIKAADKLLLALHRYGKQPSGRAASEVAGLSKTTAIRVAADLRALKLVKQLPGNAIEITEEGKKYVKEHGLEAADEGEGAVF